MPPFRHNPLRNYYFSVLCVTLIVQLHTNLSIGQGVRSVFPNDFIKFICAKSIPPSRTTQDKDSCTWTFFTRNDTGGNDTTKEISKECIRATNASHIKGTNVIFEAYLEVPEKAYSIVCQGGEQIAKSLTLSVQNVRVAEPLSSLDSSTPRIILQRFSEDYTTRFSSHDVTNETVTLEGDEVESIKLLCIHDAPVMWTNYTESRMRVLKDLKFRDEHWLHSNSDPNLTKKWKIYLDFLRKMESESISGFKIQLRSDRTIYSVPLVIRNVTSETSREYECQAVNSNITSRVSLEVENPRIAGADDILMIQQIIAILNSLAQGKGDGKEPWYTVASLLSIIFILFAYYCKKKLENPPDESQNPPATNPPAAQEEVELRTKLQPVPKPAPTSQRISPIKEHPEGSRQGSPAIVETTPLTEVTVKKDTA